MKRNVQIHDIDEDGNEYEVEEVLSDGEVHTPTTGALSVFGGRNAPQLSSAGQLVKAIGQKAFDRQMASFMPFGVKSTRTNLTANQEFVEKGPYVAGALGGIHHTRKGTNVFVAPGMADLCNANIREILGQPTTDEEAEAKGFNTKDLFDIDKWFVEKRGVGTLGYDPADPNADLRKMRETEKKLAVPWIQILIDEETEHPGFVRLLSNALEMEDRQLNQMRQRKELVMSFASGFRPVPHGSV
ncbi:hypothetical protein QKT49_gp185 [Acanthamoeba castellanii medusavirus]|uniref:Uncharacterized protein n=1 Tax=Acanthamoeba castellanii medusavirus J1 TaxID=3114988 RepID=A0A3T1CXM1_9VIRU|nr:hypothetical protein QKT49_gp185 [Acanthamoeba castellanii medusavirus]BBI30578.1 hypothetical protein [Acanthamoeba castellanii medusavirus J1]